MKATSSSAAARAAARSGAPNAQRAVAPDASIRRSRSSSLASTICTRVDQPSDVTPRKPAAESRARPCPADAAGSTSAEDEGARHRPFAGLGGALEYECVRGIEPDGAQAASRARPSASADRARTASRSAGNELCRSASALPMPPHQQIAVLVDVAAHAFLGGKPRQIVLARRRAKPCSCQASIATMRWRAKPRPGGRRRRPSKPSSSSAADSGRKPASPSAIDTVRIMAPNTSQSGGSSSSASSGQAEPAAADQPAIDPDRVGPVEGRSVSPAARARRARRASADHAGIEGAARLPQRLVGLQHHREFGKVEAADKDERPGALLGRDAPWRARRRRPTSRKVTRRKGGGKSSRASVSCDAGLASCSTAL